MRIHIALPSLEATQALAISFSQHVRAGDVLALRGDLGTGKTAFARFLIQALAGEAVDVPSPSFTILQTYTVPLGEVWHYDLYRIENESALDELALEDATQHLTLIEWPERLGRYHMPIAATLTFAMDAAGARSVTIESEKDWL